MTYQKTVGTLSPGGHPGSYNGQDAYNDMLITGGDDVLRRQRTTASGAADGSGRCAELHARSTDNFRGGWKLYGQRSETPDAA